MAAMVLRLRGAHRLVERLTQVDARRWSLQKVCETLAGVAGSEMVMLIKSDVQNTDTSGDIRPASLLALTLYRISIGRVRPEAVVLNNASLYLRYLKVKCLG